MIISFFSFSFFLSVSPVNMTTTSVSVIKGQCFESPRQCVLKPLGAEGKTLRRKDKWVHHVHLGGVGASEAIQQILLWA